MTYDNTATYTYNGVQNEYNYTKTISYSEQVAFVKMVSDTLVMSDGKYYIPLLKDVVFNLMLVTYFTDIESWKYSDEDGNIDMDKFAKFNEATGISEDLKSLIDSDILYNLLDSVDVCVAYRTGIGKDNISMAMTEMVNAITKKISDFGSNIDSAMLKEFIEKFNKSDLTANKIVQEYFNSNLYKKNLREVADEKNKKIKKLKNTIVDMQSEINAENVMNDSLSEIQSENTQNNEVGMDKTKIIDLSTEDN